MNDIYQLTWDEFNQKTLKEKLPYFTKNGRLYDILFSQQFSRELLDEIQPLTNKIRLISKTNEGKTWLKSLLSTKTAMLYFLQPSTRTFLSFATACQNLGLEILDVRSKKTSSEYKGENFEDTIRTFSSYADLIIMRHSEQGFAEKASFLLNKTKRSLPIINAGTGKDQHPTQALLDIFTLRRSFQETGGLYNKTIMMVGDLKRGRTVRSLCYLLKNFEKIKLIFSAPQVFAMEEDIKLFLKNQNIEFIETEEFEKYIPEADAIYMTRLQDEHDEINESKQYKQENYIFRKAHLKLLKANACILHPLPRREEIEESVDDDPRAVYWRQVRNGMWVRTALIAKVFEVDKKILEK